MVAAPSGASAIRGVAGAAGLPRPRHAGAVGQRDGEGGALAGLALDRHVAAQDAAEVPGDGEAQAGAAEALVVAASAWLKAWNSRATCSAVMPMPVSATRNSTAEPARRARDTVSVIVAAAG